MDVATVGLNSRLFHQLKGEMLVFTGLSTIMYSKSLTQRDFPSGPVRVEFYYLYTDLSLCSQSNMNMIIFLNWAVENRFFFPDDFVLSCFWLRYAACGILVPWPGVEPVLSLQWKCGVLTSGPPRTSHWWFFFFLIEVQLINLGFPGRTVVNNPTANSGDARVRSLPGLGRPPEEGNGIPLQYSCLRNPLDRGAWWATVHKVTNSWTWLSTHIQLIYSVVNIKITLNGRC